MAARADARRDGGGLRARSWHRVNAEVRAQICGRPFLSPRPPQDNSATWRALVKTLTQLTSETTLVLIAHTWRGPEKAFFLMLPKVRAIPG